MKIGVMGSHFVGKSTAVSRIADELRARGHEVFHLPEVVRDCPFPINEETTFQAQFWILIEQIRREMELHRNGAILVTDRTVLDNFAYMYRRWKQGVITEEQMEASKSLVKHWIRSYDLLFLLEPFEAPTIEDDKFRSTDRQFRQKMHEIILDLIAEIGVDVVRVNGSEGEITEKILERIKL